jgi:hypothetical protein
MIGFSMMHIHPLFFLAGLLSCYGLILWLVLATIVAIKDRKGLSKTDVAMAVVCLLVLVALAVPDSAFA